MSVSAVLKRYGQQYLDRFGPTMTAQQKKVTSERISADLLFIDPPWGRDWDKLRVSAEQFPMLLALLEHAGAFAEVWCKLPPSFDPATLPGAWRTDAVFGEQAGDFRRVKFVWCRRLHVPE